jgi:DNA-binding CsgD family transcriptional regulator
VRRDSGTLALLATAYDLTSTHDQWLQSLADSALPLMDIGYGTFAFRTDLQASKIVAFVSSGAPPWVRDCIVNLQAAANASEMATATGTISRYATLSQSFGRARWLGLDITKQHVLPYGVEDASSINVIDSAGKYLVVVGTVQRKAAPPSKPDAAHWTRVSSHLVAACRLRDRLLSMPVPTTADGEAILTPDGGVQHATGSTTSRSARDILRDAVRARERALACARKSSAHDALDLWKGLVEGRWSLVDRFDSDGRRYVVAHANDPAAPGPRTLTAQERNITAIAAAGLPLKVIAYELGLSMPRVSNILRQAMAKIGVTSRAELVRIYLAARHAQQAHEATA